MIGRKLTDGLSVSPQMPPDAMAEIAASGFRAVLVNRPDGEEPGQPSTDAMEAAARAAGLEFHRLPVTMPSLSTEDAAAFSAALDELPGPVLAYCRTGTRSTALWALSQAGKRPTDEILSIAAAAGYDLSMLRPRLDAA
ncbi:MAG: TIGR01244 family phosphatase [Caulobacteraceae bacterium]|nr:TIGR01244 family phosphatase [Caulobacteraceae bacterium]